MFVYYCMVDGREKLDGGELRIIKRLQWGKSEVMVTMHGLIDDNSGGDVEVWGLHRLCRGEVANNM